MASSQLAIPQYCPQETFSVQNRHMIVQQDDKPFLARAQDP